MFQIYEHSMTIAFIIVYIATKFEKKILGSCNMVDLKSVDFKDILLTGFSVVGAVLIVGLLILFGKLS